MSDSSVTSSSLAATPVFAGVAFNGGQVTTADSLNASLADSTLSMTPSSTGLLLLDQALADLDPTAHNHDDDSLYHDEAQDTDSPNDLALAAVLTDGQELWGLL